VKFANSFFIFAYFCIIDPTTFTHLKYFGLHRTDHVIKTLTNRNASTTVTQMHGDWNYFAKVRKMMVPETRPFGGITGSAGRWSTRHDQQQRSARNFSLFDRNMYITILKRNGTTAYRGYKMNKFEIELNFVKQVQLRSFFCFNTV
jgi:hypothetical protein